MRLLIIEDEKHLAEAMHQILKKNNYLVDISFDGSDGLDNALSNIYDAIILDIMLPYIDGYTLLKTLRDSKIYTPVLILSAKSQLEDKVLGLDTGADDYLAKPFETEELLARLRAITRRKNNEILSSELLYSNIKLNTDNLILKCNDTTLALTLKESQLLEMLIINKDIITSKNNIIEKIWGYTSEAEDNNVEVYISFLRKKLKILECNIKIKTIRNLGYKLEVINNV